MEERQIKPKWDNTVFQNACIQGNLEILSYLKEKGVPFYLELPSFGFEIFSKFSTVKFWRRR